MESKKRRNILFWLTMIAVAFLIISGTVMSILSFRHFSGHVLKDQDKQLMSVAKAVDNSIASCFDRYCEDLEYVTGRRGFLEAEEIWRSSGDSEELLFRLGENLLAQNTRIETVMAVADGETICSSNGKVYSGFSATEAPLGESDVCICADENNVPHLAFYQQKEDIAYAAVMTLENFYQLVENGSGVDSQDGMTLLDHQKLVYIRREAGDVAAQWLKDAESRPSLDILLSVQESGTSGTDFYKRAEDVGGYTARLAALPDSSNTNCRFTVGVINNFDETTEPIRIVVIRFLAFGGMVVAGIVLLLMFALRARYHNERNTQEVLVLREKKAAMEELNRETQEFAHHQRLEIIGQLTSSIAHEFNNLLTPIMGYSIMVLEKLPPEDEDSYENTLEIYNASRKAKEIISRLSDLSRKNTALTFQYVSPDELMERAVGVATPAKPKNVQVITKPGCRGLWLYGNETQFSQLLLNLILNGFQAMEANGGTLTISTEADDNNIRFIVKDTGPGIPDEVIEKIYDPFFTTKESGKGTGLGLAIVQQVVEEHKGGVVLNTSPGDGTEFIISFPSSPREDDLNETE